MHLLYFGSFEGILYPYVKYNIIADGIISSESDFIFHLLTSVNPDDYGASLSVASRYKTGARAIPDHIVTLFHTPEARDMIIEYFREIIVGYIERGRRDQLIGDYINIVKQDTTIDDCFKRELLTEANRETLPEFLADLLTYSVSVDPTEKDKTYPVENYNLPAENDWFTGRSTELQALEAGFKEGVRIQILYGMGGMGKSQIAARFVYDNYRSYSLIHWVNAHTTESVVDCYRSFLKSKGLPIENDSKLEVAHKYMSFMESHADWLIVYDGCDYFKDEDFSQFVKEYLPKNPATGNILITTRNNRPIGKAKRIEIVALTETEALDFLRHRTGLDNPVDAERLAIRLGCFPLALELAGAYIRATPGMDFAIYLKLLNKNPAILDEKTELTDYDRTIKEIILLTLDRVKEAYGCDVSAIVAELLHLCSYCAPDHIDLRAFGFLRVKDKRGAVTLSEGYLKQFGQSHTQLIQEINDICSDDLKRNRFSRILVKYALMRTDSDGLLSMHELQQEVIREVIFPEDVCQLTFIAFQNYSLQYEKYNRSYCYCLSHIAAAAKYRADAAEKSGASQDQINRLKLLSSVQQIRLSVDEFRILVLERASDAEMEPAHNAVLDAVKQTTASLSGFADQDIELGLFTYVIDGINYALSFYAETDMLNGALAFARFSLGTVYYAINKYGIDIVLDSEMEDARLDFDSHQGFIGDLLEILKKCLYTSLFRGYYSEYIVPYLEDLPELLEPYSERVGWDKNVLSDYQDIVGAYIKRNPFLLPESIREVVSKKFGKPFSELVKDAAGQINRG